MKGLWLVFVLCACVLLHDDQADAAAAAGAAAAGAGAVGASGGTSSSNSARAARVFAYYSTTSYTRLSTVTITALSTCVFTTTAAACVGRRKKRALENIDLLYDTDDDLNMLESSVKVDLMASNSEDLENRNKRSFEANENLYVEQEEQVDREGRILTIWTTNFSTITLTTTSLMVGTTVSATAWCTMSDGTPADATCFR